MSKIMPIVLAAGDSSRMGGFPKALLPLGHGTFLGHILEVLAAAGLNGSHVVLGTQEAKIRPAAASHNARILVNPSPELGQFSSLRLALVQPDLGDACLVWPVDQPLISVELVRSLASIFESSAAPLALPCRRGMAGHPAIFGRDLITDLRALPPGANPKEVVARYRAVAACVETEENGAFEDVDTPEDYFRLTGETFAAAIARGPKMNSR